MLVTLVPKPSGCSLYIPLRVDQALGSTYYICKNIAVLYHTYSLGYADSYYNTALDHRRLE